MIGLSLLRAICFYLVVIQIINAHDSPDYVHYKSLLKVENLVEATDRRISFQCNSTRLVKNRQEVQLSWQGVQNASSNDYIAVYVGNGAINVTTTLPVQFVKIANVNPAYPTSGNGSAIFRLINMRANIKFMLLRGLTNPVLLAVGPTIVNAIPKAPTSGHLGLHTDQRSIVVQWTSGSSKPQMLEWGPASHAGRRILSETEMHTDDMDGDIDDDGHARKLLKQSCQSGGGSKGPSAPFTTQVKSALRTYAANDMCGPPATTVGWLHPGYLHTAVIKGSALRPDTQYVYRYGAKEDGWSSTHTFISPPAVHSPKNFTFLAFNDVCQGNGVVFSDPGGLAFVAYGNNSLKLAPTIQKYEKNVQLALMIGDLAYAMGYAADWDFFLDQFEDTFTQWPLVTGTGNHERDWPGTGDAFNNTAYDSGGECNVAYHHRFYTPAQARYNDPFRSFYSFNFGSVHFLILDSESPTTPDSVQGKFVASDLASVDKSKTPWIFATLHRMMYAPATDNRTLVGDLANEARFQKDLEDIFYKYKVDAVLHGHEHAAAITCQVYKTQCVDDGPVYILAGNAGAGFTHGFPNPLPNYYEFGQQDQNGYMRFHASNTTMTIQFISSDNGQVLHSKTLTKM